MFTQLDQMSLKEHEIGMKNNNSRQYYRDTRYNKKIAECNNQACKGGDRNYEVKQPGPKYFRTKVLLITIKVWYAY